MRSFVRFYWICLKRFGKCVWLHKGEELISITLLAIVTFFAGMALGDLKAIDAFKIALVSIAGWLALFALGHLIRSPWLVNCETEKGEAADDHWVFGIAGSLGLLLILAGLGSILLFLIVYKEPKLIASFPPPRVPDAANRSAVSKSKPRPAQSPAKSGAQRNSSDDPEIVLSCLGIQLPTKILPGQHIDVALLIPGIKSGMSPYDNATKFPRLWPGGQIPIGVGAIKCEVENHSDENATARLAFITSWRQPQASPQTAVNRQHEVLLEPIDARRTRTFYLANWCQNLAVNVVVPQTAKSRFLGESSDQEREVPLLGRDHGESISLGAFEQNGQTCN